MRAIVADRNSESRRAVLAVLRELQADVSEVAAGDRFVERVVGAMPDLMIADLDTVTLVQVKALRRRMPSMNLLMTCAGELSGRFDDDSYRLLEVGSTDFLIKPFDRFQLLHRIRTLAALAPLLQMASSQPSTTNLLLTLHDAGTGRLDAARIASFMGLPLKTLAESLGRNYRTVHKTPSAPSLQPHLQTLRRSLELLLGMVGTKEAALAWLNTPSPDLAGETPLNLIKMGHTESVWSYLEQVAAGAPT